MPAFRRDLYVPPEGYDVGELGRKRYVDTLFRKAGLLPGDEVLVMLCGVGPAAVGLARRFTRCEFLGMDDRPGLLARAAENARAEGVTERLSFRQADPTRTPFRKERFLLTAIDLGLAGRPDPAAVLAEAHRVTEYGGKLLAVDLDFSRARVPPPAGRAFAFTPDVLAGMKRVGWGKVGVQKVEVLRDGVVIQLLTAKRFDAEETAAPTGATPDGGV